MKKTEIIKQNYDFLRNYRKGNQKTSSILVTYIIPNRRGVNHIGITASKKIGGAVERNRAKRIIRAAYDECKPNIPKGYDIVFVARTRTVHVKMPQVREVMLQHILELTNASNNPI